MDICSDSDTNLSATDCVFMSLIKIIVVKMIKIKVALSYMYPRGFTDDV